MQLHQQYLIPALAAVALAQGFENIGIVDFRKDFQYGRDFQLMLLKKLISFAVTMVLAYPLRSYWALLGGMVASRVMGVVLSYTMHPYRPRFDVSQIRSLMGFSQWIVLTRVIAYFGNRGPDFVLGRLLDAGSLGLFRVAREVATLPTSELLYPVMRAVFPGYAAVAHDRVVGDARREGQGIDRQHEAIVRREGVHAVGNVVRFKQG